MANLYQAINKVRPELDLIPPKSIIFSTEEKPLPPKRASVNAEKKINLVSNLALEAQEKSKRLRRVVSDSFIPRTTKEKEDFKY